MTVVGATHLTSEQLIAAQPRTYRLPGMIGFMLSALITLDSIAIMSAVGVQGFTFFIIGAIFYFVPALLITAELGSAWPNEGGPYIWIREAFGERWSFMCSWLYWINLAYYAPAVFILFAGTLATAFWPEMTRGWEIAIVIALIWFVVLIGILPMSWSKWVNGTSAVIKVGALLLIGAVGVLYVVRNGAANSFAVGEWKPSWSAAYAFLPVIMVYGFQGSELMSSAAGATRNPRRDIPRMILIAGLVYVLVRLFGNFGLLSSVPLEDLSIVTGIADAMKIAFDSLFGGAATVLFDVFVILLLFSFIGNMVTWSIGGTHQLSAAGRGGGPAPRAFGHVNRRFKTPDYSFVLMGLIGTALTVFNYSFFASTESVFWSIFALAGVLCFFPYILMFPALLVLRHREPEKERPYRVPGGNAVAWLSVMLTEVFILAGIGFFFYVVPEGTPKVTYWAITGGGAALTILAGWLIMGRRPKERSLDESGAGAAIAEVLAE